MKIGLPFGPKVWGKRLISFGLQLL